MNKGAFVLAEALTTKGQLRNTKRAMLQDAELAIGNDPVRALIELITNSDDAYGDNEGTITIEISRGRKEWSFIVKDRACGMRAHEINSKLLSIGERTSGFEGGRNVRGNLGRGAKDVSIFGVAKFETIKDGRYSRCEISRANVYELWPEVDATASDRERLGVQRGTGTVVHVTVHTGARCPQISTLARQLSNHFQLRGIVLDPKRKIIVRDTSGRSQSLSFTYPERDLIAETHIELPTYPIAQPKLLLWRYASKPDDAGSADPTRFPGILIKGQKAVYQNTLFSGEGRPNGAWFCGEIECQYIDTLIRDYDDRQDEVHQPDNPMSLIRRDRQGLQSQHPFFRALSSEIDKILLPLIDQEDKKQRGAKAKISEQLSQDLSKLGRELGKMFSEDTEDADVFPPESADLGGSRSKIQIIPGRIVAYLSEAKTITVRVSDDVQATKIQAQTSPAELLVVTNGPKVKLRDQQATLSLKPLAIGSGALTVRAGDYFETVLFEVRRERPAPPPPPTKLEFEKTTYTVKPGRQKKIRIVAPEEVLLEHGDRIDVSVKGDAVVKIGPPLRLQPNDEGYFDAVMIVEARALAGSASIDAHVGFTSAKCTAQISKESDTSSPSFSIEIENNEAGPHRALTNGSTIRIMGKHPAVTRILGKGPEFEFQNQPIGRAAIAEIVAFEMTKKVTEAKFKNREGIDAGQIYFMHERMFSKYLRKCQILVATGKLPQQ